MKIEKCVKGSFVVIGKEGSTLDGEGFIQNLWVDANSHFGEVQHLAKKDENGNIVGIWGTMSDFSRSFNPWEDFSKGLYRVDSLMSKKYTHWRLFCSMEEYRIRSKEGIDIFSAPCYNA